MTACDKEKGHFDGSSFFCGMFLVLLASHFVVQLFLPNRDLRREAHLPDTCRAGEQVLMTTALHAEYYVCETHWVRR